MRRLKLVPCRLLELAGDLFLKENIMKLAVHIINATDKGINLSRRPTKRLSDHAITGLLAAFAFLAGCVPFFAMVLLGRGP